MEMKVSYKKRDIEKFVTELHDILNDSNFDSDEDFTLNVKSKSGDRYLFSTEYTLIDLEYDSDDVIRCLRNLEVENFSHLLLDHDNTVPPYLYVFGIVAESRSVYIKVKIKDKNGKHVICVSFHYPEHEMEFPFKTL